MMRVDYYDEAKEAVETPQALWLMENFEDDLIRVDPSFWMN